MTRAHKMGWLGFACAFLGFGVAFLADLIPLSGIVASVLFLLFETTALVSGILGRKTMHGKVAIGISALVLLFYLNEMFCGWFVRRNQAQFLMRNQELMNRAQSERQLSNKVSEPSVASAPQVQH